MKENINPKTDMITDNSKLATSIINNQEQIIVVGAGWAGLSCAVKLCQQGKKVLLIEAAPNAGGRARGVMVNNNLVDNGQHVFIGAYSATQALLRSLNIDLQQAFLQLPMRLQFSNGPNFQLNSLLPQPWNLIFGLLCAKGISLRDKFLLGKCFAKLKAIKFKLTQDCSILQTLQNYQQSPALIKNFWEPIALAAMSTAINTASANVFFKVLHDTFYGAKTNSNWLLPRMNLSALLPDPALNFLQQHGAEISYTTRATALVFDHQNSKCVGVTTNKGVLTADNVVLATPAWVSAKLLADHPATKELAASLTQFTFEPITTIYFYFDAKINVPYPIIGLLNGPGQWLVDRNAADHNQLHILSVIITGEHNESSLIDTTFQQLTAVLPNIPKFIYAKTICEKRAAFSCTPAINQLRTSNHSPIANLFLAGDYTQTEYPATLEGAVRSGFTCAEIMAN